MTTIARHPVSGGLVLLVALLQCSGSVSAGDVATLGIEQFISPWTHNQSEIQQAFDRRDLPTLNRPGIFITSLGHRHAIGIKNRDIIVEIQGKKLVSAKAYQEAMQKLVVGTPARIKLLRIEQGKTGSKWKPHTLESSPLSVAELEAEQAAIQKKYAETAFRFSSAVLVKTGDEIDQLNAVTDKKCLQLIQELQDGIMVQGPNGEDFRFGSSVIHRIVSLLLRRTVDEERGVTLDQDLAENWKAVDEFMRQHLKESKGVDEDFAVSTVFGTYIVTFDDGTALFYREVWERAKERVR